MLVGAHLATTRIWALHSPLQEALSSRSLHLRYLHLPFARYARSTQPTGQEEATVQSAHKNTSAWKGKHSFSRRASVSQGPELAGYWRTGLARNKTLLVSRSIQCSVLSWLQTRPPSQTRDHAEQVVGKQL
eukprot:839743-Amphidinium_carterae.2